MATSMPSLQPPPRQPPTKNADATGQFPLSASQLTPPVATSAGRDAAERASTVVGLRQVAPTASGRVQDEQRVRPTEAGELYNERQNRRAINATTKAMTLALFSM